MAAVVVGSRLGLEQSSAWVLGSRGQLGQAATGRAGESLFVNAATGNLVLSQRDEFLIGLGSDAAISRTYNSQGDLSDDNGDNWRAGVSRKVTGLTGTLNTAGSTVRRTDWDGSETVYAWDAARSAYVTTEGAGVHDTLRLEGSTWIWTDGDTRVVERYDQTNGGRIVSSTDIDGNVLTYAYNAQGLVSRVTTADGGYTDLIYSGQNLTQLVTTYRDADNQIRTLTRVRYAYDAQNRLSSVTVDLTPGDNSVADGAVYVTAYAYDGTSRRVTSISQTDGSRVDIAYVQSGGVYRVASLTQAVAGGVSRTTSFSYDSASQTTITDPTGQQTVLTHTNGRLDRVTSPAPYAGAPAQVTEYAYNAAGDVLRVQTAPGVWTDYEYAAGANGVWTVRRDSQGLVTTRTVNAAGQIATESQYKVADPDGSGPGQPSGRLTTRYVYDTRGRMAYAISAEGRVTRFEYDAQGRQTGVVVFTNERLDVSALGAAETPSLASLDSQTAAFDLAKTQRTDITYDFRGSVASVTQYGATLASGAGSTAAAFTRTHYVYDQAGALLMRRVEGMTGSEVFVYDGLGRVVRSVDFNSQTTRTAYHDAAGVTVITTAGGLNKISSYNLAGDLVSYTESDRGPDLVASQGWPQNLSALPTGSATVAGWDNPWFTGETRWQVVTGPDGRQTVAIQAGQFDSNAQGGGNVTNSVRIDASRAYEFVFYFRKSDLSRHGAYFGLNDNWDTMEPYVEYANGSGSEVNPYFFQGQAADLQNVIEADRWYKVVGYVLPQGSANIQAGSLGGVFDMTTGEKVQNTSTFRWSSERPDDEVFARFFTYGDTTGQGYSTYFGRPEIREFDLASPNLINNSDWPTGQGGVPAGPGSPSSWTNPVGSTFENGPFHSVETEWKIVDGPDGRQMVAINSGQTDPDAAGGGNITNIVTIDGSSAYQFVYYFQKHDLTKHSLYFGLSRNWDAPYVENAVTGDDNGNPYFFSADVAKQASLFEDDRWYKVVGYVLPQGSALQEAGQWGGVFDAETGEKIASTDVYRWKADRPNDKVYSRFFNYFDEAKPGYSTYFGQPEVHKIDVSHLGGTPDQGPTTRYRYDAMGRLRQVTDPTGVSTHILYDRAGRKVGDIDADGSLVEYRYDDADRLIASIRWATRLTTAQIAGLMDGAGDPAAVDIVSLRPAAHADDVWNWSIYDAAGRLIQTIDGAGGSIRHVWDGASRLVSTTHRAVAFTATELAAFRTAPPLGPVGAVEPHAQDRTTRFFYDADGLKIGALDGEGSLSRIVYDNAGRVVQTTAFGTAVAQNLRASGDFAALLVSAGASAADINTWSVYDARGFLKGTVNGEGDVVVYDHDAMGGVIVHSRGMRLAGGSPATAPTLAQLTSAPASPTIETTTYVRNHFGQVLTETHALAFGTETIVYQYDAERRLLKQITTRADGAKRSIQLRYDRFGRLTGQLGPEGVAALNWLVTLGEAPTQERVDGVFTTRGVTFAYDNAGRMISRTDPDGVWGPGRKTVYYYDDDGRMRYEVNAMGEVIERRYDALGRLSETLAYANRISTQGLRGGLTSQLASWPLVASPNDRRTVMSYTATGAVREITDAVGVSTQFAYNAFGELSSRTDAAGTTAQPTTVLTTRAYDRRGLLTSTTIDSGGLNLTTQVVYDAFGRTIELKDPKQVQGSLNGTRTAYDRAGRVIRKTDPSGDQTSFTWDARGHQLSQTDALGRTTQWSISAFGRQVAMTTPEGLVSTSTYDENGLVQAFTDGGGRTTAYVYDRNGDIVSITNGLGQVETREYDNIGRLIEAVDASGRVTRYAYDVADRVLTETVDPDGLALTTRYVYDAFGGRTQVTDASGKVTAFEFDREGRETAMVVDPSTYAIRTTWTYDRSGKVVTLTEAAGTTAQRETRYAYDKAGRLVRQDVGPAALNVRTTFAYDANGDVIERRDGIDASTTNDVVTRYVYDAENRLTATIDGVGAVTRRVYDAKGRLVLLVEHAVVLTPAQRQALGAQPSEAQVVAALAVSASDRTTGYVYDNDDRLVFAVDAAGQPTEYVYDGSGNIIHTLQYAGVLTGQPGVAPPYSRDAVTTVLRSAAFASNTNNRTTVAAYDAAGRQRYAVDALGYVTAFVRDASGRVVKSVQYATASSGLTTLAQLDAWVQTNASAQDRTTRAVYDTAGRTAFTADAEGYVTRTTYSGDLVRSTSRFATAVSLADGASAATVAALVAAQEATAVTTAYGYDQARRVNEITDAMGVLTRLELDGLGRVVRDWAARQTADESVTARVFDAAGRVTSETRGEGTAAASTSTFTYDGLGRVLTESEPTGGITRFTYDAMGRVLTRTRALTSTTNAVTTHIYDAFGNLAKIADARGAEGFFYYDRLDRLVLQVDPERYVTETAYGLGGEPASVTRRAARLSAAPTIGVAPTVVTGSGDATTTFIRDKLDRITKVIDAGGASETYGLNAFGDRVSVTNKIGGVTTYVYDKRGLKLSETLPVTSAGNPAAGLVVNTFAYDGRGNLTRTVEASNLAEARTTNYVYDKLDRLTRKTGDGVQVVSTNLATLSNATPTETIAYDRRGNVIETHVFGGRTLFYYDDLNRKIAEVDAAGTLRAWTYDAAGNAVSARVYDTPIALPAAAGGTSPAPGAPNTYRETLYAYDLNNRLTQTTIAGVRIGQQGATYTSSITNIVTRIEYDAAGNVVRQIDARGNSAYAFHDKLGRQVAVVDAEGYATFYTRDAEGNVLVEDRFDARPAGVTVSADPAALRSGLSTTGLRTTTFTYDKNGRRLSESRSGVVAHTVSDTGALTGGSAVASKITYTYNGLGQVLSRTEANGDRTDNTYDLVGRLTDVRGATFKDHANDTLRNRVSHAYDGLGNVVRTTEGKDGSTNLYTTTYAYGAGGRLASTTDASGFTRTYAYDVAGRLLKDSYTRIRSDGTTVAEAQAYQYDALGRAIYQASAALNGATWAVGDREQIQYNTHGEVTAKGVNGLWQESFSYDKAGRLWRTTAGDGVARYYLRDAAGNATLTVVSSGTDISADSLEQLVSRITTGGVVASAAVTGVVMTIDVFDKRGQSTQTRELFCELSATNTAALITRSRAYNAFGEIVSETDSRGGVTNYSYNTMGRLVRREDPTVNHTSETGVVAQARPTEDYYYDVSGRLVASRDANGNLSRRLLLAGTGHQGTEALSLAEFHADNGVVRNAYDVYGDLRTITNELDGVEQREYDQMGRLTMLRHIARAANTPGNPTASAVQLVDSYAYDGLGQRIQHWNNQFGATYKERTDYDAKGRVVLTTDFEGRATTTSYAWDANLTTTGLGTFGGWIKTTNTAAAKTSIDRVDIFGRTAGRTDLGGHVYSMVFDKGGRMVSQTSTAGQALNFTWYNTGYLAQQSDVSSQALGYSTARTQVNYEYDASGNRTRERYLTTEVTYVYNPDDQWNPYDPYYYIPPTQVETTTVRQDAIVTYDALNRMTQFKDVSVSSSDPTLVNYTYDLNSNIRSVTADYRLIGQTATGTPKATWYRYDAMNRFTTVDGSLVNGQVVRGNAGYDIEYDAAGNRRRLISSITIQADPTGAGSWQWVPIRPGMPEPQEQPEPWDGVSPIPLGWVWHGEYNYVSGRRIESYDYTADGYLASVVQSQDSWNNLTGALQHSAVAVYAQDIRDQMGRLTSHKEFAGGDASRTHERTAVYDRSGLLLSETNFTFTDDTGTANDYYLTSTTSYDYRLESTPGSGLYTGQFIGAVTRSRTTSSKDPAPIGGAVTNLPTTQMTYSYVWWDDARQAQLKYDTNTASTSDALQTSTFAYDVNGRLTYVNIQDGRPRNVTYVTDANGQVLSRTEADNRPTIADPKDVYYYFNGARIGEVTNNGEFERTYVDAVRRRTSPPPTTPGAFHYGDVVVNRADFDLGYEGLVPGSVRGTASNWTVRDGDTLQSIASAAWGDASLWYLIAEANGLTSASQLTAGQTLSIPAKAGNVHNTSETFRPYDPNKAIGDVSPTQPKPPANPAKNKGCGVVGQIIAVAIAVAVTYLSQGALAGPMKGLVTSVMGAGATTATVATVTNVAVAAASAAIASTASQAFLVATGAQDSINWKSVAVAALTASPGAPTSATGWARIASDAARSAARNVFVQGVAVATGLQDKFSWTSVAVAGVVGGVSTGVSNASWAPKGDLANLIVSGVASGVAGAGAKSLIDGTSFGDNLQSTLPDVIGQTIGNMVAGGIQAKQQAAQRSRYLRDATEALANRPEFQDAPVEQRRHAAGSLANNDEMQGKRYGETAGVLNTDGYSALAESSRLALSPDALPSERLTGLANHLYHVNGLSNDEVRFVLSDFAKSNLMDAPFEEGVIEFRDNRWSVKAPSTFGEGWVGENGTWNVPDVVVEMSKLGTVYGMPLTDDIVSNAGGVVHRVQETIQQHPSLGYGLMALDVLTGPTTFVVSEAIEKSPIGAFVESKIGQVRDYFAGLYEGVSYDATTSRNGGTGTLTLGMLALGLGARRTLKALDVQMPLQRGRIFEQNATQGILGHIGAGKNTSLLTQTLPNGRVVSTIPDALGRPMGMIEFKDVKNISSSSQIRAQLQHARNNGIPYNLVVSPNTRTISRPLQNQIAQTNAAIARSIEARGGVAPDAGIYRYDPAADTLTEWR